MRANKAVRRIAVVLLIGLVFSTAAFAQDGARVLQGLQASLREVSRDVLPTVVEIDVVNVVRQRAPSNPFQFFFDFRRGDPRRADPQQPAPQGQEREFRRQGLGSGVIVRRVGEKVYVLTNNHVAGRADEINIKLNDGRTFKGKLVGGDERKDLALVVFETRENVPVARLGNSDSLQVGDLVLAVGNPLGFASTVTMGIVSATGRESVAGSDLSGFTDYIQTDAAINQGNSGGALVNIQGELVGINTWIASNSGGSIGLGFAIPINNARQAIDDFISKGKVEYGWLGINVGELNEAAAKEMRPEGAGGAFVFGVFQDSPADKAGLQSGDVVVRINGAPIRSSTQLLQVVGNLAPGAAARFDLLRFGQPLSVTVRIASRPEEKAISEQAGKLWPGINPVPLTEEIRRQLNLPARAGEVAVASVEEGSAAAVAGLQPGDIIRTINGREVRGLLDFYRLLNERGGREVNFKIFRQGNEMIIGLIRS